MTLKPLIFLFCLLFFLTFYFHIPNLTADDSSKSAVTIEELTATTSETHLILFGTLKNSFNSEMIEVLHSGIPLHFTFYIELYKTAKNWPDEMISSITLQHTMEFDTLKESYKVTLEEEKNKTHTFRSLFEAQKVINEINGAKVVELGQLIPDNLYKIRIKADLYRKTLPLSLHNILPFLSWWDVKTDWQTIEFRY
ncbi:hypothetical protein DGMP_10330 [Desulfomarina profundi]|uniref:DUF4390 domain-containing protein n=1 Tax=Desulfomarina profundi TaxID=2772557 RepID=A0A8D5FGS7_9BACT|nr:DUF4390 domain-containing protein [Desulfomarina profundi]BCL60340.1 hypothetical protein DGMP_10330 [Desulfomarina profundi]